MKYRPEIDGLRALAVLPVIFCHAGFSVFSGGYVGVDVFFVISGYLITLIIYGELKEERFSIIRFYERRIRRILPALFFVILACIPFAWLWMMPDEFKDFSRSIVKVNAFISNIYFWKESNYFAPDAQLAPMLHTWSLAVEEQFYVLFPLILMVFKKCSAKALLLFLSVLILASLGLSEWMSKFFPVANYYLLPSRAWELGVGSMLAVSINYWKGFNSWISQMASFFGFLLVMMAIFTFDELTPFPGLWALFPVIGAALIIAFAKPQTVVGKILSWKPIVGIGLISYSAYLWHHPLFAFARIRLQGDVSPELYFSLSLLALVLAYFTWRFIERPFRNNVTFSRREVFVGALVIGVSFIAAGKFWKAKEGFPERLPIEAREIAAWADDKNPRQKECHGKRNRFIEPENSCVYGNNDLPKFALAGDSHAMVLADTLSKNLIEEGFGLRELTFATCAPVLGYRRADKYDDCPKYNKLAQSYLLSHKEIETIILFARWTLYLEGERFNNKEGGQEPGKAVYAIPMDKDEGFVGNPERIDAIGQLYRATIEAYLDKGKRVVLVYPVPEVGWHAPYYLAKEILFRHQRTEVLSTSFTVFKERTKNVREQLDRLASHKNLLIIKPEYLFCNTLMAGPGRCIAQIGKNPVYLDDNHLNTIGGDMLSKKIIRSLKEKDWLL